MVKPTKLKSWEQLQASFAIPDDLEPSIARRKAELYRMLPDLNFDFEESDFGHRTMWDSFLEQRRVENQRGSPKCSKSCSKLGHWKRCRNIL